MKGDNKPHFPKVTATKPQFQYAPHLCGCGCVDTEEGVIHEDDCPSIQPSNAPPDLKELEWLRYFYKNARHSMGPADGDIYRSIAEQFKKKGNVLPKEYEDYLFGE